MNPVRLVKKIGILIAGVVVIVVGIILLPLPGPGFVVIGLGLFILSTEFEWADRYLQQLKRKLGQAYSKATGKDGDDKAKKQ